MDQWLIMDYLFPFIAGSCVGSFLNVCIYRLPKEISIVRPRSFCPRCNAMIKWYDNIPIISYIVLGARCRNCKGKIPFRYFLVELLAGCLFVLMFQRYGLCLDFFRFTFFFCLLIVVSFIDIEYHAIPASLCFLGIIVGLLMSLYETFFYVKAGYISNLPITEAFKGLVFGFGFAYLFKFFGDIFLSIYLSIRKKESIEGEKESLGLGDVDFMGMVGVFLGMLMVVTTFFIAPFIAVLYSVFALILKRSHLIPYLPYLSLAAFVSYMWGTKILYLLGVY